MNNSLLEEIQAAYDAHNIEPIRCIYFHLGLGYACPLTALAIHRGIVNKSDPHLELDGDDNPALAWACDEFGADWVEGFVSGFDGDDKCRKNSAYVAGYEFGERTLEQYSLVNFRFNCTKWVMKNIDTFLQAYIVAALWSSTDEATPEGGEFLDANYGPEDLAPETLAQMKADCDKFQAENASDIAGHEEQAGHDLWLTRNFHGSGFWDGDWQEAGDRLTEACKKYPEVTLYVGDDNLIYS